MKNYKTKYLFVITAGLLFCAMNVSSAEIKNNDISKILRSKAALENKEIKAFETNKYYRAELIFANAGTAISAPKKIDRQVFWDFSYLYFYNNREFSLKNLSKTKTIIARNKGACKDSKKSTEVECIITKLAVGNNITVTNFRYDEGYICEAPVNILNGRRVSKGKCTEAKY